MTKKPDGQSCRRLRWSVTAEPGRGLPVRGYSHPIITRCGSRRLRGSAWRCSVLAANPAACSSVCRLSLGSAIHSRMTVLPDFLACSSWFSFVAPTGRRSPIAGPKSTRPAPSPRPGTRQAGHRKHDLETFLDGRYDHAERPRQLWRGQPNSGRRVRLCRSVCPYVRSDIVGSTALPRSIAPASAIGLRC